MAITENEPQQKSDYEIAISAETRELLGIEPLRMYQAYESPNKLVTHLLDGLTATVREKIDGTILDSPQRSNTLLFPVEYGKKVKGLFEFPSYFKSGSNGVGVTSIPEPLSHDEMLRTGRIELGRAKAQYALIAVGDENSTRLEGVSVVSMEGGRKFIDFKEKGEDEGMAEVAHRLTRLAGGRHITKTHEEKIMSLKEWESYWERVKEVIRAGNVLEEKDLLPHVGIERYTDEDDRRQIEIFLGVSGVSEGQISLLDDGVVFVTGTGTHKGNLKPNEVVPLVGLHYDEDGRIIGSVARWPDKLHVKRPSVEGPENVMVYAAAAGVASGDIDTPDISGVKDYLSDHYRVLRNLMMNRSPYESIVHIHKWFDENMLNSDLVSIQDVNRRLMPNGAYHASCGTEAQALIVVDAVVRGMHEDNSEYKKILGILMPNHGMTMVSPYPLTQTVDMLVEIKDQFIDVPPR